jgi:DNA-binding MarR family transcriptional regulator
MTLNLKRRGLSCKIQLFELSIPKWNAEWDFTMRRIKLRHLDTLAAFMKTGSVTEAAVVLRTTQPNASKSLKQLEDFAGVKLFERSAGRLRPTPEAELLFAHATRLMDELTLFENFEYRNTVSIQYSPDPDGR